MSSAHQVLAVDQHLNAKHKGCRVWVKVQALSHTSNNVTGWAHSVETQHSIHATIRSVVNEPGQETNRQEETCKAFKGHFPAFFRRGIMLDKGYTLQDLLAV